MRVPSSSSPVPESLLCQLIPRGFLGSCMISECNSIWVDWSISLVHKYQFGTEVFRHGAAVPWLMGVSEPPALLFPCGQSPEQETGSSATLIPYLLLKNSQDQGCLSFQDWTFTHTWRKRSWKSVSQCHLAIPDTQTSPWARTVDLQGRCFSQDLGLGTGKCLSPQSLTLSRDFALLSGLL